MQYWKIAAILAFAAAAEAGPLAIRDVCNAAPSGPATGSVAPSSNPAADNAAACQQQCVADPSCQSFVFGHEPSSNTPQCQLYAVPASHVPQQSNANLMVYDKGCSGVPGTKRRRRDVRPPPPPSSDKPSHVKPGPGPKGRRQDVPPPPPPPSLKPVPGEPASGPKGRRQDVRPPPPPSSGKPSHVKPGPGPKGRRQDVPPPPPPSHKPVPGEPAPGPKF